MKAGHRLFVIFASTILTACGSAELGDLRQFTANAHANKKADVDPLPELRPHKGFAYTATKLVDPFSPANLKPLRTAAAKTGGLSPDVDRRKEPLENYPLDSLRMMGILARKDVTWALLGAPDGSVYHVQKGNYVGQNFGVVTGISEDKVVIDEMIQGPGGNWIKRAASLAATE